MNDLESCKENTHDATIHYYYFFFFTLNNFCHILKIVGKGKENLVKEMEEFRSKLRNKSGQAWQKQMNFNVEIYSSTHVSIFKTFFFFSHFSTDDIPFGV